MSTMDLLAKIRSLKELETLIIQTVMKMDFSTAEIEIEMPEPDVDIPLQIDEELINEAVDDSVDNSSQNKLYIKWSNSYKEAHKLIF